MAISTRRQSGFALIVVLIVVALATSAAVAMTVRLQHGIGLMRDVDLFTQARLHLRAVELWAGGVLLEDAELAAIDTRQDIWTAELQSVELDSGVISASITDLQGRLNLNNLAGDGEAGELERQRFGRLLQILGLDTSLVAAVADWVDEDQQLRPAGGAEDGVYLSMSPPYRAANQPLAEVSELLLVRGVDKAAYAALEPFVCALPIGTSININTAPVEVLMALADGITQSIAEQLHQGLALNPFSELGQSSNAAAGRETTAANNSGDNSNAAAIVDDTDDPQSGSVNTTEVGENDWTWTALKDRDLTVTEGATDATAGTPLTGVDGPIETADSEFLAAPLLQGVALNPVGLGLSSRYFMARGQIRMAEDHVVESRAVLFRNQNGQIDTLWRSYGD